MGFGLIFVGYTMLLTWGYRIDPNLALGFDILPDLLGYYLIFRGLRGLKPYSKGFVHARLLMIPLMAAGGVTLLSQALALAGEWAGALVAYRKLLATVISVVDTVSIPLLFFLHVYLCQGIRELAAEVDLPKVVFRSKLAVIFSSVFYLGKLLGGLLPLPYALQWVIALLTYVVYFYTLFLLYSCYMHIVYADETPRQMFNPLFSLLDKKKRDSDQD